MHGSRTFCPRGSNFDKGFLVDEIPLSAGHQHYQRAIIGPPAKRHLMPFHWRTDVCTKLNAGLIDLRFFRESGPALLRNPIFFRGGPDPLPPPPPPLDPPMLLHVICGSYRIILHVFFVASRICKLTQGTLSE